MIHIKDDHAHEAVPTPELAACIVALNLNELAGRRGYDLTFSSGLDRPGLASRVGKNATGNSWHPFGLAWDYTLVARYGTEEATQDTYDIVAKHLHSAIGKLFDVIAKPHGTGAHIHVEYDVGGRRG